MKKMSTVMACLIAFTYVVMLFGSSQPAKAASGTISTDQAIYPIWRVGGTVRVTPQNLASNITYYLWLEKPERILSSLVGTPFTAVSGSTVSPILLPITPQDPAGTYVLSLSTSALADTKEATAHFGVSGTDSQTYERTNAITVAGGGFAANSSISIDMIAGNRTFPGFPINVTARANGEFEYNYKLVPSTDTGTTRVTMTGVTYDKRQTTTVSSLFAVTPTTIVIKPGKAPAAQVERTTQVNATYTLRYPDDSPVTTGGTNIAIMMGGQKIASASFRLINSTTGEWQASWVPPPSANTTLYHFQLNRTNFTDAYGNAGQGSPLVSKDFTVVPAKLQPTVQTDAIRERTQEAVITITAVYHNGANVANVTQANVSVIQSDGRQLKLVASLNGPRASASFKIPVNATLGNWTVRYVIQDPWGNSASGKLTVQVLPAIPVFQLKTPSKTERTTFLNVTTNVSYPDGTPINKTITLLISHGNLTWTPKVNYNSTTLLWSGSLYIAQNATLGPYNISWAVHDTYGNAGRINSTTLVIPAQFRFVLQSNNSTVEAFSNLDLPVIVRYPNGSSLTNDFGNVTSFYTNSTGSIFTLPLAYNQTNGTWHMYFSTPQEGNFTFSFSGVDRFGNAGQAMNAFRLKIVPSSRVQSQRLIIAGIIGALVPIALLVWAIATVSTRRRKHRP